MGKSEGKGSLVRTRHRCEDYEYIKLDNTEIGLECMNWIDLARDGEEWWAVVNTEMKFLFAKIEGNILNG